MMGSGRDWAVAAITTATAPARNALRWFGWGVRSLLAGRGPL